MPTGPPGKVAAQINLEAQGGRGGHIGLSISKELNSWANTLTAANASLTPYGIGVESPDSSWTDAFPFNSAGIPAMTFSASGADYAGRYHTNYDVQSLIDWQFFGKMNKLEFRFAKGLDRGLLPYNLKDLADDVASTIDQTQLEATGANATVVGTFVDDVAAFQAATAAFEAGKASLPAAKIATDNASLLQIEKKVNKAEQEFLLGTWARRAISCGTPASGAGARRSSVMVLGRWYRRRSAGGESASSHAPARRRVWRGAIRQCWRCSTASA